RFAVRKNDLLSVFIRYVVYITMNNLMSVSLFSSRDFSGKRQLHFLCSIYPGSERFPLSQ
ncbi:MAG: hypothetical protein MI702_11120, partial [Chlorobiales bacterium]|nr:hypothetical protein [Chlorobiales bacterium]